MARNTTTVQDGETWEHESSGLRVTAQKTQVVRPESKRAPKVLVWFSDRDGPEEIPARLFHKDVLANKAYTQIN